MSKPKVYVTRQLFDEALEILRRHAEVEVFGGVDDPAPRETILSNVRDVEGLLCLLTDRIDSEVIEAGRRLKVISDCAVGFNNIDVEAATSRGVYVTNTPGILTDTTADCVWALLLAVARRIAERIAMYDPGGGYMLGGRECSSEWMFMGRPWES